MIFLKMDIFKTTTYYYRDGFFIDIQKDASYKNIYIFHSDYGVKMHVFGLQNDFSNKKILKLLENQIEPYIDLYKNDYMD